MLPPLLRKPLYKTCRFLRILMIPGSLSGPARDLRYNRPPLPSKLGNSSHPAHDGTRDTRQLRSRRGPAAERGGLRAGCGAPGLARRVHVAPPRQAGSDDLNPIPYTEVPRRGTSLIQRSPLDSPEIHRTQPPLPGERLCGRPCLLPARLSASKRMRAESLPF